MISVPGGANRNLKWMDRFVDSHFEDKRVIYIAGDADPKGEELKQELLRRLGRERCRVVSYGEGCKDANELLVKAGPEALSQALADAPEMPLEGVYTAADVDEEMRILLKTDCHGERKRTEEPGRPLHLRDRKALRHHGTPGRRKIGVHGRTGAAPLPQPPMADSLFQPRKPTLPYHLAKLTEN